MTLSRTKISKGFYQSGYGRGFNKTATIYLINNKYYAKSKKNADSAFDGDLLEHGYVCVNIMEGFDTFCQVHLAGHQKVND